MNFLFCTEVIEGVDRHASCSVAHYYSIDGSPWQPAGCHEDLFPFESKDPLELASEIHHLRALQTHQVVSDVSH